MSSHLPGWKLIDRQTRADGFAALVRDEAGGKETN